MNLGWAKAIDRRLLRPLASAWAAFDELADAWRGPAAPVDVRQVAALKFWGLGNLALLRPVLEDVRRAHPAARLTVLTLAPNAPLVGDLADRLLLVSARSPWTAARDLVSAVRALRRSRCDLALDFEPFATIGALVARAAGIPQRIGFARPDGRRSLANATVPFRADAHAARSFRDLAEAAGVPPGPVRVGGLAPSAEGRARLASALGAPPPAGYVVLHPGSGDNFVGRRWTASGFAALGRAARARSLAVYVTGTAAEATTTREVAAAIGDGARDLAARLDVEALVALLAGARALACNDTGPVHLASQMQVPVLAFYGPNTPVVYGPLSAGSRAMYRGLACSPCLTPASYRSSRCRLPTCMASIGTGAAQAAFEALLAPRPATAR